MATTGHARRRRHCCGMNDEEAAKADKYGRELIVKTGVSAVLYPLANIKTLFQLGYEPFPLSTGKMFGIGREAYFLPNGFSYGRNMLKKHGWSGLYNGVDAAIVATLVGGSVSFATSMYLDRYFPDIGGKPVNLEKEERELSEEESVRRLVRSAIRETAARTVGVIVARPFTAPKRQLRDQRPRNYNAKIFDDVSTSIFDKYEWGPLNYYVEKPSDSKHSQQFAQNRATIFLMMVSLVVLIIVLVIGFHMVKAVVDQRRKLSIPKVFEQTPKKKLDKSKTVKQCSEPSSNISVDGKRSAPMNTKASSLKDDSHSSSSKQQSPPERETAV